MLTLLLLASVTAVTPSEADQRLARMAALYERVCLEAFPDDKAVETLMAAQSVRELTPEEVKVTMRDDPARGWLLNDGNATVWIEFPPYHACSVRWGTPTIGDLSAYRVIAAKYEDRTGGFAPVNPYDADLGDIHVHATGEQRTLPDKSRESLYIFLQNISNPKRREAGETGFSMRFVHQFAPPPPGTAK